MPACNPGGNLEVTLGGDRSTRQGEAATHDHVFQLKTLFRELEPNGWGWGLTVGTIHHPEINPGPNQLGNSYVSVPVSASFGDDRLVLHGNLGSLKDRASGGRNATWSFGGELKLTPTITGIAKSFGDNRTKPYWQLGGRIAVIPGRVQVDASTGRQTEGPRSGRWISFGLRFTPERLY